MDKGLTACCCGVDKGLIISYCGVDKGLTTCFCRSGGSVLSESVVVMRANWVGLTAMHNCCVNSRVGCLVMTPSTSAS